jgi:Rad3-related DNA helicase
MGADIEPESFDEDEISPRADRDKFGVRLNWTGCSYPHCAYWEAKDRAIHSPLTIHNYPYYLHEQNYAHSFNKRYLGIFDEAHTIENVMMQYIEVLISSRTFNNIWMYFKDMPFPIIPDYVNMEDWKNWLIGIHKDLVGISEKYGTFASIQRDMGDSSNRIQELKSRKMVENLTNRINELISDLNDDIDNWVALKDKMSVTFKPVTINKYTDQLFKHTQKHILVSATILDKEKLAKFLGIEDEIKFFRINDSTFPVEHRPFYQKYAGKAVYKEMPQFLPKMINTIDGIISTRLQYKGVIHTHTNEIARYVMANSKYKQYMMTNVALRDDGGNFINNDERREDIFERFFQSKAPNIMVTPSMKMGVDLKDDLARWQIICKIPYPSLGDPQIKKRVEKDQSWYDYITSMLLIQSYGRICRTKDDWGETFIVDGKFSDLYDRSFSYIPKWFKEAIR